MALADAVGAILTSAFNGLWADAALHVRSRVETPGGSAVDKWTGTADHPAATAAKAQLDRVTQAMRDAEGYAATDVGLMILRRCNGIELPEPKQGDRLTLPAPGGSLYSVEAPITLDAAGSHWSARGAVARWE